MDFLKVIKENYIINMKYEKTLYLKDTREELIEKLSFLEAILDTIFNAIPNFFESIEFEDIKDCYKDIEE